MSARKVGRIWVDEGPASACVHRRVVEGIAGRTVGAMVPPMGRGIGDLREHTGRRSLRIRPLAPPGFPQGADRGR